MINDYEQTLSTVVRYVDYIPKSKLESSLGHLRKECEFLI